MLIMMGMLVSEHILYVCYYLFGQRLLVGGWKIDSIIAGATFLPPSSTTSWAAALFLHRSSCWLVYYEGGGVVEQYCHS